MKTFSLFFLIFLSLNIFAKQSKNRYLVKTDFYINDQKIGSRRIGLIDGGTGSIEMKNNFISVTSIETQIPDGDIKMNFEVGRFDENGKKIVLGQPSVITQVNQLATLIFSSAGGDENYKIEILPKKLLK